MNFIYLFLYFGSFDAFVYVTQQMGYPWQHFVQSLQYALGLIAFVVASAELKIESCPYSRLYASFGYSGEAVYPETVWTTSSSRFNPRAH